MKIIRAYPPNFGAIKKAFPYVAGRPGILYAWGDRIYNPTGVSIVPWVRDHEQVHGESQMRLGSSVKSWWDLYLHDPQFRLQEEILAHQQEWQTYQKTKGTTWGEDYLYLIAKRLSSPLYGSMTTYDEAVKAIQNGDTRVQND